MTSKTSNLNVPNNKCPFCGIDTEINNKLERHLPSCEYKKNTEQYINKIEPNFNFHNWVDD